jgi:hypothetical protein
MPARAKAAVRAEILLTAPRQPTKYRLLRRSAVQRYSRLERGSAWSEAAHGASTSEDGCDVGRGTVPHACPEDCQPSVCRSHLVVATEDHQLAFVADLHEFFLEHEGP